MEGTTEEDRRRLTANLESVRLRMRQAAAAAARTPDSVRLVAVTKGRPAPYVDWLLDLGVDAVGENRPEEMARKQDELDRPVPWHLIGHYQRKKVAKTVGMVTLLHSVHSLDLLSTIELTLLKQPERDPLDVLIQVNASGEVAKQGFAPLDVEHAADIIGAMSRVRARGLMTMAPEGASTDQLSEIFGRLRELAAAVGRDRLPELSMGMSGDFETAIREGSTMVRIGSALFDGIGARS